jgi:hypothetical protein
MDTELEKQKALLDYYREQYQYRHKHFWSLITKHIFICAIIIIFPYLTSKFEIEPSTHICWMLYRIAGVIISALFVYLLLCESARMRAHGKAIKLIINEIGGGKYEYPTVEPAFRISISVVLPFVVLVFHILLAILY